MTNGAQEPTQPSFSEPDVEPWPTGLRERIEKARSRYHGDVRTDQFLYNGGTIVILLTTTCATLAPSVDAVLGSHGTLVAQVLTGTATFLVAVLRALSFGERWVYNRDMEAGYNSVLDMIDFYEFVPRAERPRHLQELWTALYTLRRREGGIPGVSGGTAASNPA